MLSYLVSSGAMLGALCSAEEAPAEKFLDQAREKAVLELLDDSFLLDPRSEPQSKELYHQSSQILPWILDAFQEQVNFEHQIKAIKGARFLVRHERLSPAQWEELAELVLKQVEETRFLSRLPHDNLIQLSYLVEEWPAHQIPETKIDRWLHETVFFINEAARRPDYSYDPYNVGVRQYRYNNEEKTLQAQRSFIRHLGKLLDSERLSHSQKARLIRPLYELLHGGAVPEAVKQEAGGALENLRKDPKLRQMWETLSSVGLIEAPSSLKDRPPFVSRSKKSGKPRMTSNQSTSTDHSQGFSVALNEKQYQNILEAPFIRDMDFSSQIEQNLPLYFIQWCNQDASTGVDKAELKECFHQMASKIPDSTIEKIGAHLYVEFSNARHSIFEYLSSHPEWGRQNGEISEVEVWAAIHHQLDFSENERITGSDISRALFNRKHLQLAHPHELPYPISRLPQEFEHTQVVELLNRALEGYLVRTRLVSQ